MITSEAQARDYCRQFADAEAMERLEQLVHLLLEENQRQNLISKATLDSVWQRHIADSAQLLSHVPRGTQPWLDLGTGAGFPGLVIAALRPEWDVRLVESRKRRTEWLETAGKALGLTNCRIIAQRLELVDSFTAGTISARAFAPLPKLLSLSARFSGPSTCWLLPKGRSAAHELDELSPNTRALFHVEQSVTDDTAGIIVGTFKGRL
ncbi:16S rRNA (guanine(527)-N(7))-methyltransferase RsmG [Altericroceibacterium xinjiangense]|uniref:16S rRNA (guanine(527)-N(7))-methyltransferase RsmG n=1 Tax=Altericroceibacterium xinjiangense TaxID=762261 RepID=UPI000F7EF687|nr:16S rRNA (guanine(527)-N(7))-methyltransferase RsmG [Altericroceibacterium xinjiangense]